VHHIIVDFGAVPFPYLEGQSIGVIPPGLDKEGRAHAMRLYWIAGARDGERPNTNNMALAVKRINQRDYAERDLRGIASNWLCDLELGAIVVDSVGPFGSTFLMPNDPDADILMICTGTGVSPFRGFTHRRRPAGGHSSGLEGRGPEATGRHLPAAHRASRRGRLLATVRLIPAADSQDVRMAPKYHPTPLSGGDRKALAKELGKARAMANILVAQSWEMRAKGEAMIQQADKLLCESWNERMWSDGEPIDPSPTIDQAVNGGFPWLEIECTRCKTPSDVDLAGMKHPPTTFVHDLASRLRCRKCAKAGRRPAATLLQLAWQPRHPRTDR
jgi:hypothetical protein